MNLFFLSDDPREAARMMCDKHVIKMIVETAQMLSTAHRVFDGQPKTLTWSDTVYDSQSGVHRTVKRTKKLLLLPGERASVRMDSIASTVHDEQVVEHIGSVVVKNQKCYHATHANHPSNVWIRKSGANYDWTCIHLKALLDEYTYRYDKVHKTAQYLSFFNDRRPGNLEHGVFTHPPQAMPEQYQGDDAVAAYRDYYVGDKIRFAKWTRRVVPDWFIFRTRNTHDVSCFIRPRKVD